MLNSIGLFVIALGLILLAAVLFTNGVEWLGKHLGLSEGGVGSVLAAVGTALPETIIPLVAILWIGGPDAMDVGVGAIVGAPFMLATLTLPLTGIWVMFLSAMKQRRNAFEIARGVALTDLGYFLPVFSVALAASFVPVRTVRFLAGVVLLGVYLHYLKSILAQGEPIDAPVGPLYFARWMARPPMWGVSFQIAVSLALMITGAHIFVDAVGSIAPMMGVPPLVLSLILTPIATELPEKFNSLVWISQKKDTLAIGNITGAMVFQGTVPVSIGLFFTPWKLGHASLVCVILALSATLFYFMLLKTVGLWRPWHLAAGALLYAGFVVYVRAGL